MENSVEKALVVPERDLAAMCPAGITPEMVRVSRLFKEIEARMREGLDLVDLPVEHEFADGIYARKMTAPANCLVLGKRHRYRTLNILLSGEVTIYAGESMPVSRIKAPATFTSDAMTQKLIFFHEKSEFVNIHPTMETDVDKIEKQFIVPESEFLEMISAAQTQGDCGKEAVLCHG